MFNIKLICVGKMKERFYIEAVEEYAKRLGAFCRLEIEELPENRLSQAPSAAEIETSQRKEAQLILERVPKSAVIIAMCIEGEQKSSEELAQYLDRCAGTGISRLCFVIGGSTGLHDLVKQAADMKLSMSRMTFPHHLARVMLLEQIYRGFKIKEGSRYHK